MRLFASEAICLAVYVVVLRVLKISITCGEFVTWVMQWQLYHSGSVCVAQQ
jgi:hypothetical protein